MATEEIRFVIWDLDETFWRGTVTEGGITEYLTANHDLVIELAKRGIMSGICSKNDHDKIESILRDKKIWDYFVFPSISWAPKGPRLKQIAEDIGLRPATILFLDDNPGNRAEAKASVPGLIVADETYAAEMLGSPLFKGKADKDLTRLAQYKVLEAKLKDRASAGSDNTAFLKSSEITVRFEYDIAPHIDRVVELINRTNQLNYTKNRLPENADEARALLRQQASVFHRQCALVHVQDRYGDYGYCGFFMRENGQAANPGFLLHYCFSCRTLGMLVERWVYDHIGRPQLNVSGEVLTDLSAGPSVDWIRLASDTGGTLSERKAIPEVRLRGGCEIDALSHYFTGVAAKVSRETSAIRHNFFAPKDHSHHLFSPGAEIAESYLKAAQASGFVESDLRTKFFAPCEPGSLFIFAGWSDSAERNFRHRKTGRLLNVPAIVEEMLGETQQRLNERYDIRNFDAERRRQHDVLIAALREAFEPVGMPTDDDIRWGINNVFLSVPPECLRVCLLKDEVGKDDKREWHNERAAIYNKVLRDVAEEHHIALFDISKHVLAQSDRHYTGHFDRIVYYRLAQEIISWAIDQNTSMPLTAEPAGRLSAGILRHQEERIASG